MNRAAALLARPGAWLEAAGEAYLVRVGTDRRRRPLLRLDEAAFAERALGLPRRSGQTVLVMALDRLAAH